MGKKTKIVLDTNIWVSIFFSKILSMEFYNLFENNKIEVFISEEILKEIARVLEYPKIKGILDKAGISPKEVLEEIMSRCRIVNPEKKLEIVKKHTEDNKFLECAIEAKAEYIVSGDKYLLEIEEFGSIKIVSAKKFLKIF